MNSSISSFDLPEFPGVRSAAYAAAATFLAASLAVILVNAWIDPFDADLSPFRKDFDRASEFRTKNVALWAAFDIHQLPDDAFSEAKVVIVGDSRARMLSGGPFSDRTYTFEGKRVLDLSFGGAALNEALAVYYAYADRLDSVETVILSLGFDHLDHSETTRARFAEADRNAKYPLLYFLNFDTLKRSLPFLFRPSGKMADESMFRPDRLGQAQLKCDRVLPPLEEDQPLRQELRARAARLQWPLANKTFDDLVSPFLDGVEARGARHVIFIPPNSPWMEEFLNTGTNGRFERFQELLRTRSKVVRVPPERLNRAIWQDDWHVCRDSGTFLFDQIWPQIF